MNQRTETIQIRLSPEERRRLEAEAQSLHLTVDALAALRVRGVPEGFTPERWNRILVEVFGRYGDVIRRLA
jgi:hypothetical protein